jgi:hypothetical protein
MTLDYIVAKVTLDTIVFDITIAFVTPLVALLTSSPVMTSVVFYCTPILSVINSDTIS